MYAFFFSSIISSSYHCIEMYKVPGKLRLVSFTYWIVLHQWSLSLQCCETSFLQVYDCCRLRLNAYTHFVSKHPHAIEVTGHKLYTHLMHFLRSCFLHLCLNHRRNLWKQEGIIKIKTIGYSNPHIYIGWLLEVYNSLNIPVSEIISE